jgi:hypothetical protein
MWITAGGVALIFGYGVNKQRLANQFFNAVKRGESSWRGLKITRTRVTEPGVVCVSNNVSDKCEDNVKSVNTLTCVNPIIAAINANLTARITNSMVEENTITSNKRMIEQNSEQQDMTMQHVTNQEAMNPNTTGHDMVSKNELEQDVTVRETIAQDTNIKTQEIQYLRGSYTLSISAVNDHDTSALAPTYVGGKFGVTSVPKREERKKLVHQHTVINGKSYKDSVEYWGNYREFSTSDQVWLQKYLSFCTTFHYAKYYHVKYSCFKQDQVIYHVEGNGENVIADSEQSLESWCKSANDSEVFLAILILVLCVYLDSCL